VQQEAVDALHRHLLQVLVRAMHGISCLERDHRLPTELVETTASLQWRQAILVETIVRRTVHHLYGTADVHLALCVKPGDSRVRALGRAEAELCLAFLVVGVDVRDLHDTGELARGVRQRDLLARRERRRLFLRD
jgi:hypothetical protein